MPPHRDLWPVADKDVTVAYFLHREKAYPE